MAGSNPCSPKGQIDNWTAINFVYQSSQIKKNCVLMAFFGRTGSGEAVGKLHLQLSSPSFENVLFLGMFRVRHDLLKRKSYPV